MHSLYHFRQSTAWSLSWKWWSSTEMGCKGHSIHNMFITAIVNTQTSLFKVVVGFQDSRAPKRLHRSSPSARLETNKSTTLFLTPSTHFLGSPVAMLTRAAASAGPCSAWLSGRCRKPRERTEGCNVRTRWSCSWAKRIMGNMEGVGTVEDVAEWWWDLMPILINSGKLCWTIWNGWHVFKGQFSCKIVTVTRKLWGVSRTKILAIAGVEWRRADPSSLQELAIWRGLILSIFIGFSSVFHPFVIRFQGGLSCFICILTFFIHFHFDTFCQPIPSPLIEHLQVNHPAKHVEHNMAWGAGFKERGALMLQHLVSGRCLCVSDLRQNWLCWCLNSCLVVFAKSEIHRQTFVYSCFVFVFDVKTQCPDATRWKCVQVVFPPGQFGDFHRVSIGYRCHTMLVSGNDWGHTDVNVGPWRKKSCHVAGHMASVAQLRCPTLAPRTRGVLTSVASAERMDVEWCLIAPSTAKCTGEHGSTSLKFLENISNRCWPCSLHLGCIRFGQTCDCLLGPQ